VGDTIEINSLLGEVKSIGIRSSNVRTYEGAEVIVPNSVLVSDQLINWTLSDDKRRIEVVVGVKYGTDPGTVIQILKQVADAHPLVAKDPEPRVLFTEFADSSLNFRLLCWVLFENGIQTKSDLSVAVDHAFKENGIEIPFPQLDLHVIDNSEEKELAKDPAFKPNAGGDSGKIEGVADKLE
jgi:small-conductance mechanosensitive channel